MSKKNSIVEINGQRYSARTDQKVPGHGAALHAAGSIDGILATPSAQSRPLPAVKPQALPSHPHTIAAHHPSHAPQSAQTLMRHTVKKPTIPGLRLKANGQALAPLSVNKTGHLPDSKRLHKARIIKRSPSISRFGDPLKSAPSTAPRAVQLTGPASRSARTPITTTAPTNVRTTADLLEQALNHANSHQQPAVRKKHFGLTKRLGTVSLVVVVGAALLGLVASQNINTLKVQVASAKAGFNAGLPGYSPAGYSVQSLDYSPGTVAVRYHSNSDERTYTITEKSSAWDSETLRDIFITKTTQNYQTVEAGGRTIYLYGNQQASWVNAGIWYQVQSTGSLSNRQLVSLATSL